MGGIRLSRKHGVNATLIACGICGGETNELALLGWLPGDAEAPRRMRGRVNSRCDACATRLQDHVACLRVDDDKQPTGELVWLTDAQVRDLVASPELVAHFLRERLCLIGADGWAKLGLPVAGTLEWDATQTALRAAQTKTEDTP
jgi:hypothetical protein